MPSMFCRMCGPNSGQIDASATWMSRDLPFRREHVSQWCANFSRHFLVKIYLWGLEWGSPGFILSVSTA